MGFAEHFGRDHAAGRHRVRQSKNAAGRWWLRQFRGVRPDRNPLRRRIDRTETYLLTGLFAAAAAAAPGTAIAVGHVVYDAARNAQQEQLGTRHQVPATLTQAAPATVSGYEVSATVLTPASWTSVTGVHRSGDVLAQTGSPKGTVVPVWASADGSLVSPPLTDAQVSTEADVATIGAIAGVVVLFIGAAGTAHYVMYRRRLAAWEADWLVTSRTWNHHQSW